MTMRAFVFERIDAMSAHPSSWAYSKEAFGLQLVLLAEIALYEDPRFDARVRFDSSIELTRRLYGPGNTIPDEPFDEVWARQRADITKTFLAERFEKATQ